LLGAQGKTVFDPDFDIDDSGLPHEKPAIPAIECPQRVDCVAKVGGMRPVRNNRIQEAPPFESILRSALNP
jgi:hypothetical protein